MSFSNGPGKPRPSAADVIICPMRNQCAVQDEVLSKGVYMPKPAAVNPAPVLELLIAKVSEYDGIFTIG